MQTMREGLTNSSNNNKLTSDLINIRFEFCVLSHCEIYVKIEMLLTI